MSKVVILGIFVADVTFRADRMPKMGETLLGNSFSLGPGGKGSNQAVAAGRAGAEVSFITKIGRDTFGDMAMALWDGAGVRPAVTRSADLATGAASIFVDDATGNNAIIVAPGAANSITAADIEARADLIGAASVFLTQLEQPLEPALAALRIARRTGVRTILNPAPAATLPDEMIGLCDFITPNESEAEALTGVAVSTVADAEAAARVLLDKGVGAAVITLGGQGALYCDSERVSHVPAITAGDLVETTGAGDAFNGGFATALSEGADPLQAVKFGTAVAALSVCRAGAAQSMPTRAEIDTLLAAQT